MYKASQNGEIKEPCISRSYDIITSLYPFDIQAKNGQHYGLMTYSIVNTILYKLFETPNKYNHGKPIVCIGGRIELFFKDPFDAKHPQLLQDKLYGEWFLPDDYQDYRYIYIPLTFSWLYEKAAEHDHPDYPHEYQNPMSRWACNGKCSSGHFCCVLIDQKDKTIEYFDSDSSFAPWYSTVLDYLKSFFADSPFKFHKFHLFNHFDSDDRGVMDKFEEPVCALYATLYIWKRTIDGIPREELLNKWHNQNREQDVDMICRWNKFLEKYWKQLIPTENKIIPMFEKCINHDISHGLDPLKTCHFIAVWLYYNFDYAIDLMKEKLDNCRLCKH